MDRSVTDLQKILGYQSRKTLLVVVHRGLRFPRYVQAALAGLRARIRKETS
jgi:hypothetical protein